MKLRTSRFILFIVSLFLFSYNAKAQYLHDINGVPITTSKYEDVTGTPYLADTWLPGTVKLTNGTSYKNNLFLKYNVKDDELYFKGRNDEQLLFVDPIAEFIINTPGIQHHYKNGYKSINGYSEKTFFEILAEGSIQLLKKTNKTILESKAYNSPITDRRFVDVTYYYIVKDGNAIPVKKDRKSILTILADKQSALEKYMKDNDLNIKNDSDFSKIIVYYNSL